MTLLSEQPNLPHSQPIKLVPVLEGGGTRLSAHVGILKALKPLNIHFDRLVGVSGGSIVSALYASGLSLEEVENLIINTDFNQFLSFSLLRLIRQGGFCSGDVFENWMDEQLKGITFRELKTELHIVATDIKRGKFVIFARHTTPDILVSLAVRFSMSIPLIFALKPFAKEQKLELVRLGYETTLEVVPWKILKSVSPACM